MRRLRLALGLLVAIGLAPGTFVRSRPTPAEHAPIRIEALAVKAQRLGPFTLAGAWRLSTRDKRFGGYSALVAVGNRELVAASDTGRLLRITRRGGEPVAARLRRLERSGDDNGDKINADVEALTRDPESGTIWAAYEARNVIERFDARFVSTGLAEPDALHGWSSNAGPEVFARLPDGRFLAIEEDPRERAEGGHNAVLFGRDPVAGGEPAEFLFAALDGFYPVDAVARADGRVLVLMRRVVWGLPPRFEGAIVLIDPARIEPGRTLHGRLLARLKPPLPMDNFEGMALTRDARGARYLWLISDDNLMGYQRTLLLRLRWDPARPRPQKQRARGSTARP